MRSFPSVPWYLTADFMRVRKSVGTWLFYAAFKVNVFAETEKIPTEYWNNRNLLMNKNEPLFQKIHEDFFQLIKRFLLFNIHAFISKRPLGFYCSFKRIRKSVSTCSFCATFKARNVGSPLWILKQLLMCYFIPPLTPTAFNFDNLWIHDVYGRSAK